MNKDLDYPLQLLKDTLKKDSYFNKSCQSISYLAPLISRIFFASLYIILIYSCYLISKNLPYIFISFNTFSLLFFYALPIIFAECVMNGFYLFVGEGLPIGYEDWVKGVKCVLISGLMILLYFNTNVMDVILYEHKIGGEYPIKLVFRDRTIACQIYSDLLENPHVCKMTPPSEKLLKSKNLLLVIMDTENKIAVKSQDNPEQEAKIINSSDVILEYESINNGLITD